MITTERLKAFGLTLENRVEGILATRGAFPFLVVAAATVFVVHWSQVSFSVGTVGPDYGHYLIAANWYAGIDRSGEGPFDPPVIPLIIVSLGPSIGRITFLRLLGPFALATAFVAAVFLFVRFVPRWAAVAEAAAFVQWQTFSEFITSGGVTNLFGLAFGFVFFRLFYDSLEVPVSGWRPNRREALGTTVLFLLASTHHFTTLIVGATILVWLSMDLILRAGKRVAILWTAFRIIGPGAALSLIYVPYFGTLVATDAESGLGRPASIGDFYSGIVYAWQSAPEIWIAFLGLAGLSALRFRAKTPTLPMAFALALTPLLLLFSVVASHSVRTLYFLPLPLIFLAFLWLTRHDRKWDLRMVAGPLRGIGRVVCLAVLVLALIVLPGSAEQRQRAGIAYYHQFMSQSTLEAFDWIASQTSPDARFAVDAAPLLAFNDEWKGMATGWWLEGLANRRAIYEANPPLLPFQAKWEDARDANRLFSGETVFENGVLRVADSFPFDDAATPKVYTAYFGDFREFVGFAVPRLVNSSSGRDFTLILGADTDFQRSLSGGLGQVIGTYSGPSFNGTRSTTYDFSSTTVWLALNLTFDSLAGWTGVEMTVRLPPWTEVNLEHLDQGLLDVRIEDGFELGPGEAQISFESSNLTAPTAVAPLGKPGEGGIGVHWDTMAHTVSLVAKVVFMTLPPAALRHSPIMRTSNEILESHRIDFLFVTVDATSDIQRFDRQPSRFARVFVNAAVVMFAVRETG